NMLAGMHTNVILIRLVFTAILVGAGYVLHPIQGNRILSAVVGAVIAAAIIFFELRIRRASLKTLICAAVGSIMGIIGAYLTGTLIIPQFILRELQQVADSPDSSKRQRGRRGLDMLNRLQNNNSLDIQIVETDFPAVREVDLKLIELGKQLDAVIVTNDFNLNKVAQLRGVNVLNINELANGLKPVVLPGEAMRVFILKEGKEYNQGVAYLDDGTMVVVDNARRLIGKNADIAVTS